MSLFSQVIAILSAFFLPSVPLLTYHAFDAYADLPLSCYALALIICFRRYMERGTQTGDNNGFLVLTGLFAAFCIWTKAEGILFSLALTVTVFLYLLLKRTSFSGSVKGFLFYAVPIAIVGISWFAFLFIYYITGRRLQIFPDARLHLKAIPVIVRQMIFSANFNIIFAFFAVVTTLGIRSVFQSDLKYLLFPLLSIMMMFLLVYVATDSYRWVMNLTSVNRNILTIIPMTYYVSALITTYLLSNEAKRRTIKESS